MVQHTSPQRTLGVVTLSGTVAGLIAAIGARIAMRIVALGAHQPPLFTFEGTFHILLLGTLTGFMLGAIISSLCVPSLESPRTRRYVPGPLVRDLLVGLILFLLLALPNFFNTPRDNDFSLSPPYLGRSLFGALFLVFGLLMGGSEMLLHRYLPGKSLSASAAAQQGVPSLKSRLFYTLVISVMTGLLVVGIWHITALFGTPSSAAAITMTFTGIAIGLGCFYAAGFITGIVTKVRWMGLLTGTLAGVLFGAVDSLSTPGNLLEADVVHTFMMTILAALFSLLGAWLATRKGF